MAHSGHRTAGFVVFVVFVCTAPLYAVEDGGWVTNYDRNFAKEGPCNIDRRDASSLSQEEFLQRYAYTAPVVITGLPHNQDFEHMCLKDVMLKEHGGKIIRLSSANTYSYSKVDVTLNRYVHKYLTEQSLETLGNETLYWFGDNNYTEWEGLFEAYTPPPYFLPQMTGAYSFGLAGAGTGVPFHFHGPGFAEVIYGKKRWFMYPPEKTPKFHPDRTTLQWLYEEYEKLHPADLPLECTVGPREAIYFPDHWWHGTLNVETSVFISTFLAR